MALGPFVDPPPAGGVMPRLRSMAGHVLPLARSNTAFVMGVVLFTNLLRIVSSVILTRLLDASAFGIIGLLTSIAFVFTLLFDAGFLGFIVRHEEGDDPEFLDQIWTIRLIRSVIMAVLMLAAAWPIAEIMQQPLMAPVLAVWSLTFVIEGCSSLAFATALRTGMVKRLSLLDLIIAILQLVFSVLLTLWFESYWGLVAAGIVTSLVKAVLTFVIFPNARRWFRLSRSRIAEVWTFSKYVAGSSLLQVIMTPIDKIVLARLTSIETFGLFTIASSLAYAPAGFNAPFAEKLLYPAVAREVREGRNPKEVFYRKRWPIVPLHALLVGGLIGAAPLMVEILYDPRYRGVTEFFRIIAIATFMAMLTATANEVALAYKRTNILFKVSLGRAAWLLTGAAIALASGNAMVLIWTVGLLEVVPLIIYWHQLKELRVLDLRRETISPLVALAGGAVGWAGSAAILRWVLPT